jgi:tRNA modification GTPase
MENSDKGWPRCGADASGARAVATVAVCGQGAVAAVARRFTAIGGQPLADFAVGRVVFGRFRTHAGTEEELVVGLVGRDEVEIHCHGGSAAVAAAVGALVAEGCELTTPDYWANQTQDDPLSAAALLALACARTEKTAAVLLDQYRGALRSAIRSIERQLDDSDTSAANAATAMLIERSDFGLHLVQPWKVVLVGRPNSGKSSLLNAIVGYERAIVFSQPGTTRDVLTAGTALDGWPVELADTAGLREPGDELEAEGVARRVLQ